MNKRLRGALAAGVGAVALLGAGMLTNGLPEILAGQGTYSNLEPGQLNTTQNTNCCGPALAVDTNRQGGAAPQSVAATPYQVAATLLEGLTNTQTSTVGAATSNTLGGVITTEALATAAGANYTFTLTNSGITPAYISSGSVPQVGIYSATNTGGTNPPRNSAQLTLVSSTMAPAGGTVVWVFRNDGNTALNGTMRIGWHL